MGGSPVVLNVYDLSPQNAVLYWCGVGVFHTGVEVYGVEYAYGGHDYDVSGIFATSPHGAPGLVVFRQSIDVGETDMTATEVHDLVQSLGQIYRGNRYHLLQKNCNHFAQELVFKLTGHESPGWVNRLASLAIMLHCLLPPDWVPALQTPSKVPLLGEAEYARNSRRRAETSEERISLIRGAATTDVLLDPPRVVPALGDRV